MIILTFTNGIVDINILNTAIVVVAITVITTVIYLPVAGVIALIVAVFQR